MRVQSDGDSKEYEAIVHGGPPNGEESSNYIGSSQKIPGPEIKVGNLEFSKCLQFASGCM